MHDVILEKKILAENSRLAGENRTRLRAMGVRAVNLISSPGAGKTTLIEAAAGPLMEAGCAFAVIEGDLETTLDSERISRLGVPVRQITTGRACHLDAHDLHHALEWVASLGKLRLLVIENVGNMVCPAEYDLGEDMKVTVLSVAEGDDKPLKYPAIFSASGALVINKIDLVPYTDFSVERARENALKINPALKVFETSARTGAGIEGWAAFLASCVTGAAG